MTKFKRYGTDLVISWFENTAGLEKLLTGFTLHSEVHRTNSGHVSPRIINVEIPVKSNAFHQSKIT